MNMKNTNLPKSLYHAACGFLDAFKRERNLRIHICIADLIMAFAYVYGISKSEFAVLVLTITVVVSAELLNSAVEKNVDIATNVLRADAKHSKDFAAAATLVCAVGAVGVGICLFFDPTKIAQTLVRIFTNVRIFSVFAALFLADVFFMLYPVFIRKHKQNKAKKGI